MLEIKPAELGLVLGHPLRRVGLSEARGSLCLFTRPRNGPGVVIHREATFSDLTCPYRGWDRALEWALSEIRAAHEYVWQHTPDEIRNQHNPRQMWKVLGYVENKYRR